MVQRQGRHANRPYAQITLRTLYKKLLQKHVFSLHHIQRAFCRCRGVTQLESRSTRNKRPSNLSQPATKYPSQIKLEFGVNRCLDPYGKMKASWLKTEAPQPTPPDACQYARCTRQHQLRNASSRRNRQRDQRLTLSQ